MTINFPSSPALDELYTHNNRTWQWDGTAWLLTQTSHTHEGLTTPRAYANDEATMYQRMLAGRHPLTWEDFDSNSLPGTFVGWASSPFSTPFLVDLTSYPSVISLRETTGTPRSFLYRNAAPGGNAMAILAGFVHGTSAFIGIRLDDGTDNNYVECGLANNGTNWIPRFYYRTGGGAVNAADATTFLDAPITPMVVLAISGTQWSNWGTAAWLSVPMFSTLLAQKKFVDGPTGLTWTPTRTGITFRNLSGDNGVGVERFGWT